MHARNRTWTLGSDPAERCRQRTLPVEGGDGSTLSLDFTTGILDPRLNFTRGTNATFINSQGLVQWANSNMFRNTVWTSTSLPTGWLANPSNTGTITYNGDGTISCNASSQTAWIYPNFPYVETANGLSYICSVRVVSISAPAAVNAIVSSGNLTALEYFIDGVSKLASDSVTGPCVVSVRVTASGTQWYPRLGAGVQGVNVSFNLVMSEPHAHPGVAPRAYMANTSTSAANFNTPRFDYDPTSIGTPRGLLIEGSATNLCTYSGDMTQSGAGHWTQRVNLDTSAWTGFTAPDGTSTAVKLIPNTTNGLHNIQNVGGSLTLVAYTASAFVKADGRTVVGLAIGGSQAWQNFVLTGNGSLGSASTSPAPTSTITPVGSNGWYRVTMTWTSTLSAVGVQLYVTLPQTSSTSPFSSYAGDGTQNGVQAWGYQLEVGSGASSYIPSGASQGSRGQDGMTMADISSLNFNQSGGTVMMQIDGGPRDLNTFPYFAQFEKSPSGRGWGFLRMNVSSSVGPRIFGTAFDNAGSIIITSSNHLRPSGKVKFATTLEPSVARMTWVIAGGSALVNTAAAGTLATIGSLKFNNTTETAATDFGSVWVSQFKYWPSVLPESQMQAITT